MINFKKELNKEQYKAVCSTGVTLCIAGAGTGKCVAGSTLVYTNKGIIPIKDIPNYYEVIKNKCESEIIGFNDYGKRKKCESSHWFKFKKEKTITIKTESGYSIRGTYEHPIVVLKDDGKIEFKKINDIKKDDYIALSKNNDLWSKEDIISKGKAYILGLLVADGYLAHKSGLISLSNSDPAIIKKYYKLMKKEFGITNIKERKSKYSATIDHDIFGLEFKRKLERLGLKMVTSTYKEIPWSVLCSSKKVVKSFLQGYLDVESSMGNSNLEVCSASKKLIHQLQVVLLNFGIRSSVKNKKVKSYKDNKYYRLTISGFAIRKFKEEIDYNTHKKYKGMLKNIYERKANTNVEVYPNQCALLKKLKNKYNLAIRKRYLEGETYPSLNHLYKLLNKADQEDSDVIYLLRIANNFLFEKVEKVTRHKKLINVYDFTVPMYHSFVANGFINHNTRVLIHKVAKLIEDGVDPKKILLLTFTNKAAKEMMYRASKLIKGGDKIQGGTFHSFALKMLRKYHKLAGFKKKTFTVLDNADIKDIIAIVKNELPKNIKRDIKISNAAIYNIISKSLNRGISVKKIIKEEYDNSFKNFVKGIILLKKRYKKYKDKNSLVDFDDILFRFRDLLDKNPKKIRWKTASMFKYVLVDEYQDTNTVQDDITYLITDKRNRQLMVVGDEDQSIYKFRGAKYSNILEFENKYDNVHKILLVKNYRSYQEILNPSNNVINKNKSKDFKKELVAHRGNSDNKPIYIKTVNNTFEAEYVLKEILKLKNRGIKLNDIAVLFRYARASSYLEPMLNKTRIHYVKYGGIKFFDQAHIKDLMCFLRLVTNIKDKISWLRVLKLVFKVGDTTATGIMNDVLKVGLNNFDFDKYKKRKYGDDVADILRTLKLCRTKNTALEKKLETINKCYDKHLKRIHKNHKSRIVDIQAAFNMITERKSIVKFLDEVSLENPENNQEKITDNTLVLSTIHSAKGLEWKAVFIICFHPGSLPSVFATTKEDIEEERRLAYVAMTRAEDKLYITNPKGINKGICNPDDFMEEDMYELEENKSEEEIFLTDDIIKENFISREYWG